METPLLPATLSKTTPASPEGAAEQFERMGFSLLFSQSFEPAEERLLGQHIRMTGMPVKPKPADKKHHVQWWRHPAGVLAKRHLHCDYGVLMSSTYVFAFATKRNAHQRKPDMCKEIHDEFGQGCWAFINALILAQSGAWEEILDASRTGRLLPFHRWPAGHFSLLHTQALPIPRKGWSPDELDSVDKRALAFERLVHRDIGKLVSPWRKALMEVPPLERPMWARVLSDDITYFCSSTGPVIDPEAAPPRSPAWLPPLRPRHQVCLAQSRHELASRTLNALGEAFLCESPLHSTEESRQVARLWLEVACDPRPSHAMPGRFEEALSRSPFPGTLGFHHLLLSLPEMPGALEKAMAWQSRQSSSTLARLCVVPDADGLTLPMRLAQAWMHVPVHRHDARLQRVMAARAHRALGDLASKVDPKTWVWNSPDASVWDPVLYGKINTPGDQDLIAPQALAADQFASWVLGSGAALPSRVRVPGQGWFEVWESALPVALESAQAQGAIENRDEGGARLSLLGNVPFRLYARALDASLGAPLLRAKRPRM